MMVVPSFADWTAINLAPDGSYRSSATGVYQGNQVGWVMVSVGKGSYFSHASLWSGSAESWVDLNPSVADASYVTSVYADRQAGFAYFSPGIHTHAGIWSGTASSWVDLNPDGASSSHADGIFGDTQVGCAKVGDSFHAGLWHNTANSWVDLNPAGATASWASGVFEDVQVGCAEIGGSSHAGLWHGSADSWVDLGPIGSTVSYARAVYADKQVGATTINKIIHEGDWDVIYSNSHASLWSESADSWVDLHPSGASDSRINAILNDVQVGYADFENGRYAGLWRGTAQSWEKISSQNSEANGITSMGDSLWVAGSCGKNATVWQYTPVPEPSTLVTVCSCLIGLVSFTRRRA